MEIMGTKSCLSSIFRDLVNMVFFTNHCSGQTINDSRWISNKTCNLESRGFL